MSMEIPAKEKLPDYEENFGHIAEAIIRDSIGKKAGMLVEKVEKGTKAEDIREKVDFWIKFREIDEPLGIQYTCSNNENKIQDKRDFLRKADNIVKKEEKPDAEIKWSGNANVILVRGNMAKLVKIWEESQKENISPAELVGDEFIRNFFSQVLSELSVVNPVKKNMLLNIFFRAAEKKQKSQKK